MAQAKNLVEQEGTPFLCLYIDQKTQQVNLVADSVSQKEFRESKAFSELQEILTRTNEKKTKLQFYDNLCDAANAADANSCCQLMPVKSGETNQENSLNGQMLLPRHNYDKLPAEILRIIFEYLKPTDLRNILLVSQTWKSVAEEPVLWTGFDLPDVCRRHVQALLMFSNLSLFSKLQHLALSEFRFKLKDEHVELFCDLNLSSIEISKIDLSEVSDQLLGKLVSSCKELVIKVLQDKHWGRPGVNKAISILSEIQDNSKLKSLKLIHNDDLIMMATGEYQKMSLLSIPSDFFARLVRKLDSLTLANLHLSSDQLVSVFDHIINLSRLSFRGINLDATQTRQLMDILGSTCQLKSLSLSKVDMGEIPVKAITKAILKVETVDFEDVKIETDQIEELFLEFISLGDSKMKHLSMILMTDNLFEVDAVVFANAVNKLESIYFDGDLPETMIKEMFQVMSLGTNLKTLGTPSNQIAVDTFYHITEVDPQVLAMALNNLQSVRFDFGGDQEVNECFLSVAQMQAFFKHLSLKTKVKTILRKDHYDFVV